MSVPERAHKSLALLTVHPPTPACSGCGHCCQRAPGVSLPSDWSRDGAVDFDAIRAAIASGRWIVDWTGDGLYFLRPAVVGFEGDIFAREDGSLFSMPPGQTGQCTFLGPKGCTSERKPFECSVLEPVESGRCETPPLDGYPNLRYLAADLWRPYSERLLAMGAAIRCHHG